MDETPGSFEWSRASSYLKQCEAPFRSDVEPAMLWRFVPQVFVWMLGGNPIVALCIPWLGGWALLAYLSALVHRRYTDDLSSLCCTLMLGATTPILVSTGWLGFNDAWVALGLCYLAFGRHRSVLAAACVLCPFIDERFVFGVPCAVVLRNWSIDRNFTHTFWRSIGQSVLAVSPFLVGRSVGAFLMHSDDSAPIFLLDAIRNSTSYLWFAPLGIWMALRVAYLPIIVHLWETFTRHRRMTLLLLGSAAVPLAMGIPLAADTTRTAGILLPLAVWSAVHTNAFTSRALWIGLAFSSLVFAAAQVTYTKISPINSLPFELWRLFR